MAEEKKQIEFSGIGDDDQLPYTKFDVVKACRIGNEYAVSLYQIDYQALVNALTGLSKKKPEETKVICVGKFVCNEDVWSKFFIQMQTLKEKFDKTVDVKNNK